MDMSGDAIRLHMGPPRIATTSRAPVLVSETPNLHNSANSKVLKLRRRNKNTESQNSFRNTCTY